MDVLNLAFNDGILIRNAKAQAVDSGSIAILISQTEASSEPADEPESLKQINKFIPNH